LKRNVIYILFIILVILSIIYIRFLVKPKVAFMPITLGPSVSSVGMKALEEAKPSFKYKVFPVEQSSESAVESVRKAIEEGYKIILAPEWTSSMVYDVAKSFDDILIVASIAVSDELRTFSNKIITLAPSVSSLARIMGRRILRDGIKELLIVEDSTNPSFVQAYKRGVFKELGKSSIKISSIQVQAGEATESIINKLKPFLEILKGKDKGILFICGGREVAIAMNYLKMNGAQLNYYSSSYCLSEDLYKFGKKVIDGLVVTSYKPRNYETVEDIGYIVYLYVYDSIKVLDEALKKVRDCEPRRVREYIIKHEFSGKTGRITFGEDGFRNYLNIIGLEVLHE